MKKVLCVTMAAVLIFLLCACNFTTNFSDSMGITSADCIPEVEAVLQALTDGKIDEAATHFHPNVAEKSDDALEQMRDYLNGRSVSELTQQGFRVNTSTGTAGKVRQEAVTMKVVLEDGTVCYLSATRRADNDGEGFVSFQLVLGVV
jgi:cobalamin biosynthesis Co2+ chelatase CbiK